MVVAPANDVTEEQQALSFLVIKPCSGKEASGYLEQKDHCKGDYNIEICGQVVDVCNHRASDREGGKAPRSLLFPPIPKPHQELEV